LQAIVVSFLGALLVGHTGTVWPILPLARKGFIPFRPGKLERNL